MIPFCFKSLPPSSSIRWFFDIDIHKLLITLNYTRNRMNQQNDKTKSQSNLNSNNINSSTNSTRRTATLNYLIHQKMITKQDSLFYLMVVFYMIRLIISGLIIWKGSDLNKTSYIHYDILIECFYAFELNDGLILCFFSLILSFFGLIHYLIYYYVDSHKVWSKMGDLLLYNVEVITRKCFHQTSSSSSSNKRQQLFIIKYYLLMINQFVIVCKFIWNNGDKIQFNNSSHNTAPFKKLSNQDRTKLVFIWLILNISTYILCIFGKFFRV